MAKRNKHGDKRDSFPDAKPFEVYNPHLCKTEKNVDPLSRRVSRLYRSFGTADAKPHNGTDANDRRLNSTSFRKIGSQATPAMRGICKRFGKTK